MKGFPAPPLSKRSKYIGDELWHYKEKRRVLGKDFENDKSLILIHGFTASGSYMEKLCDDFMNSDYNVFLYNYNSFNGIERAAKTLSEMLQKYDATTSDAVKNNKVSLICHSMGGLVGRALHQLTPSSSQLNAMVTLGTPHAGTLDGSKILGHMVKWGENLTKEFSGFHPSCQSAAELTLSDAQTTKDCLLARLNRTASQFDQLPVLSISGGKRWLEVGSVIGVNVIANFRLQKILGQENNDGLVVESSSNFGQATGANSKTNMHYNDYSEYPDINHTYLIHNQTLSLEIQRWLAAVRLQSV